MSLRNIRFASLALRLYTMAALLAAAFLSPAVFAFVALALLAFYLYLRLPQRNKQAWSRIAAAADLFVFFAVIALLQPRLGAFSILTALPILGTLVLSLESAAARASLEMVATRRPTGLAAMLFLSSTLTVLVFAILGNGVLAVGGLLASVLVAGLAGASWRALRRPPVAVAPLRLRMIAGSHADQVVSLTGGTTVAHRALLLSPYPWLTMQPAEVELSKATAVELSLTPPLSGPNKLTIQGSALDRFGLIASPFSITPLELLVTPKARYAAWVARRYVKGTGRGILPLLSTTGALRGAVRSVTGIEYYGSRTYQPGDSLREIDWKHSAKLNQLVTKEFTELRGRSALVLVNLATAGPEEADEIAYKIIAAALFFAREKIPAAIAAYDQETVRLVTATLPPASVVPQSLSLMEQVTSISNPLRYLAPPDLAQLRANLFRLGHVEGAAAETLTSLFKTEYESLKQGARVNPSTRALVDGLRKADHQSNLVVISQGNHDSEALAFNTYTYRRRGYAVIMM